MGSICKVCSLLENRCRSGCRALAKQRAGRAAVGHRILADASAFQLETSRCAIAFNSLLCILSHLQYYECLPNDAIEDLRHERDFECPKASTRSGCNEALVPENQTLVRCLASVQAPDWAPGTAVVAGWPGGARLSGASSSAELQHTFARLPLPATADER